MDPAFTAPVVSNGVSFKENIVRAGLNYRFSGPNSIRVSEFNRWEVKPRYLNDREVLSFIEGENHKSVVNFA